MNNEVFKFDWRKWDVPIPETPLELRNRINSFGLIFKTIKSIKFVDIVLMNNIELKILDTLMMKTSLKEQPKQFATLKILRGTQPWMLNTIWN